MKILFTVQCPYCGRVVQVLREFEHGGNQPLAMAQCETENNGCGSNFAYRAEIEVVTESTKLEKQI